MRPHEHEVLLVMRVGAALIAIAVAVWIYAQTRRRP